MSTPPNLPEPPKDQHDEQAPSQQPAQPQQTYPPMPPQAPYPPQYGQSYSTGPKTSGLAITGFVLAVQLPLLFWIPLIGLLSWLANLAGFIISIVAVSQIKNSNGQLGGKGLAVAGIVLSCVWFGLLILMIVVMVMAGMALMGNVDALQQLEQLGR